MSILAALLGWTKLPPWALELIVIGLVAGGIWYWHHATLERGIAQGVAKQVTADDAATAKVKEKAARDTAALRARAEAAEKAYATAQDNLDSYRAVNPIAYRVCLDAPHDSGPGLPAAGTPSPGAKPAAAAATVAEPLPPGNPVSTEDRGRLLDAFGAFFEQTAGQVREFQARR